MTPSRAATLRGRKIEGEPSRKEQREAARAKAAEEEGRWTFDKLWEEWKTCNANKHALVVDENRYLRHLKEPFGSKEPKDVSPFAVDKLRVGLLKGRPHAPGRAWDPKAKRRADESKEKRQAADFRPNHGLRHTFASHLRDETLKRGANVMSRIVAAAEEKVAGKAE